jgi:predicted MFS family arabinose efflux permease
MNFADPVVYGFVGIAVAGLLALAWNFYFAPDARHRKRRQRNYGRVTSREQRPMVKFSVRTR